MSKSKKMINSSNNSKDICWLSNPTTTRPNDFPETAKMPNVQKKCKRMSHNNKKKSKSNIKCAAMS